MSLRILVVTNMGRYSVRQQVNGIYRRIDEGLPWDVRLVSSQEEHSTKAIGNALKWRPDGVIVSNNERSVLSPLLGYKTPVVVIDPWKSTLAMGGTRLLSVSCDNEGIGRAAADALLRERRYHSFGFIGGKRSQDWSVARGDAFAERLNENGIVCLRYEPTELVAERTGIVSWLRRLPKRCVVVNVGRGNAVDEEALVAALRAGRLAGAYLDVIKREPTFLTLGTVPASDRGSVPKVLGTVPNLVVMPHASAFAPQYLRMCFDELKDEGLI